MIQFAVRGLRASVLLAEIASKAMSPGINDSGTAIRVIGSVIRVLSVWSSPVGEDERGRLLKTLEALASTSPAMRQVAREHARILASRAEQALDIEDDLSMVRAAAAWLRRSDEVVQEE